MTYRLNSACYINTQCNFIVHLCGRSKEKCITWEHQCEDTNHSEQTATIKYIQQLKTCGAGAADVLDSA